VSARPDSSGHFRTPDYAPGRYRLIVSNVSLKWRVSQILLNGQDVRDGFIELADEDITGVTVTLVDKEAVVTGTITDEVAKARQPRIVWFPADFERWISRGMHPWSASNLVRADMQGRFRLTNLRPGRYLVAAVSPTVRVEITNPEWIRQVAPLSTLVDVMWDNNTPIALQRLVDLKR
jgi:hypothetical protein